MTQLASGRPVAVRDPCGIRARSKGQVPGLAAKRQSSSHLSGSSADVARGGAPPPINPQNITLRILAAGETEPSLARAA